MARQRPSREARQPIDGVKTKPRRDSAGISTNTAEHRSQSTLWNVVRGKWKSWHFGIYKPKYLHQFLLDLMYNIILYYIVL